MAIECPHCTSFNAEGALHCNQCGSPLGAGSARARRRAGAAPWIAGLALAIALVAWSQRERVGPGDPGTRNERPAPATPGESPTESLSFVGTRELPGEAARIIAGWLEIEDPRGAALARIPCAVSREGWLALPRALALGASRIRFRPGRGAEAEASEGLWRRGEEIALWRIDSAELAAAPPLAPWAEAAPLDWFPYDGGEGEPLVAPPRLRRSGLFLRGDPPIDIGRGGVLVQDGQIVGWATAEPAPALWLYTGAPGSDLAAEISLADFYDDTFAGGREEGLAAAHALAESEAPRQRLLAAFGEALRRPPRLEEAECRAAWLPASAVAPLLRAMRALLDDGAPQAVLSAIDQGTLELLADGAVLILYTDAIAAVEGSERAIALLDRWGVAWIPPGHELEEQLLARLARHFADAVATHRAEGDLPRAWSLLVDGRRRFPEDPELLLGEAELWLDEGDWRRAEGILTSTVFPARLGDRVALLERLVSELKGMEGRIVIRFRPGAPAITTHAMIGGVEQLFIVDTGASFTSIPWSTVRALGIPIDASTPRRELRTASDVISAPVVTLAGVTLGGWTVEGVEATVLDLPGQDAIGLLGLNFLEAFRVDLDRAQGILALEPK